MKSIFVMGAAVIFAAMNVFAVQELETLNGMPDASDNVWRYYAAGEDGSPAADVNCVVQGDWVFGATFDAATGALGLGASYYAGEEAKVLNLLNVKVETADGVQTEVKKLTFPTGTAGWQKVKVKEIWATDAANLPTLGYDKEIETFKNEYLAYTNNANIHIKRIYIKSDWTMETKRDTFAYCYGLTNVILRCPNLVKWAAQGLFFTCVTNEISDIVSPNVQSMGKWALCWWGGKNLLTGSLIVTNQMEAFGRESYGNATNVYLRGDHYEGTNGDGIDTSDYMAYGNNGSIKTLTLWYPKIRKYGNGQWMQSNTSLKEVRLYMPRLTNMVNDTFANGTITSRGGAVYVLGPVYKGEDGTGVIGTTLLQSMMGRLVEGFQWSNGGEAASNANNSGLKRGKIYMSKKWGWKEALEKSAYFVKLSDEADTYEAKNAPEGCFGVWAGKGSGRRAYLVDYPQDGEPHGLVIRIQ